MSEERRPFTGAWIETPMTARLPMFARSPLHGGVDRNSRAAGVSTHSRRRPFTGAWIETAFQPFSLSDPQVAPSRGRGSKHFQTLIGIRTIRSPLHGGVDRNAAANSTVARTRVAPSRGRGSKHRHRPGGSPGPRSPLHGGVDRNISQVRDLIAETRSPLHGGVDRNDKPVVINNHMPTSPLHGGVDRNLDRRDVEPDCRMVAPSRGRGSKHVVADHRDDVRVVAPSRGRGSKLHGEPYDDAAGMSPLHGGVDRNKTTALIVFCPRRRPFTGAWIETLPHPPPYRRALVAPSRGRGSKHLWAVRASTQMRVAPSRGRGSKRRSDSDSRLAHLVAPSRGRGSKLGRGLYDRRSGPSPLHGGVDRNHVSGGHG